MNIESKQNILSKPNRQSPIAIFLILWKVLRQLIRQAWPFLLFLILPYFNLTASSSSRSEDPWLANMIIAVTVFSTISSLVSYFKYYYYIQEDELVIEKGLFQKVKINMPFDRIQTINFEQTPIHQFFNVVRMEIDSAGSVQNEISIQAIDKEKAEYIRSYIMAEKAKIAPTPIEANTTIKEDQEQSILLMQHSPLDLLKIGVSQNHLRGLGIIFGFCFWIFQSIEDFLPEFNEGENPVDYVEEHLSFDFNGAIILYLFGLLLLFSIGISLISTVFRYFNLQFFKTDQGFKVKSGLLTKREQSANLKKIQLIRWGDSLLKRLFGIFRLNLFQASSAALSASKAIGVPGCYIDQINTVRTTYFPNESEHPYEQHGISSLIIGRRLLYIGLLPALAFMVLTYHPDNYYFLLCLLWIPFIFFTSRIFHRNWKVFINQEGIHTEHGIIGKEHTLLQWYKIQSVTIRQSLYQQRKAVADVYFFTAAGSVKIPYFPLDKAQSLKDYVLYKVEQDRRDWM